MLTKRNYDRLTFYFYSYSFSYTIFIIVSCYDILVHIVYKWFQSVDNDNDVRELLTLLALLSEPNNIDIYFDINNDGFNYRYNTYLKEINKLSTYNNNNCNTTLAKINQVKKI